jgi:hypothetical protein
MPCIVARPNRPRIIPPKIRQADDRQMNRSCDQYAYQLLRLPSPVPALRLVAQAERSNTTRDVETGAPFEAERLQRNRSVGAADQYIGAGADTDRGAAGGADVFAGQRARRQI